MTRAYRYISGDSHLEVLPDHWLPRVPAQYRDMAPHVIRMPDGGDAWAVEGQPFRQVAFDLYGGKGREDWFPWGQNYETTPGADGDPAVRVRLQDEDGIDAEVLFPNQAAGPNFWRHIRSDDVYRAVIRAYNDWLAEFCSYAPERLLGLALMPMTNLEDSLAELEHAKKLGLAGVMLGIFPSGKGQATPADDTFWKAALDIQMPITAHQEFNREGKRGGPLMLYPRYPKDWDSRGPNADLAFQMNRFGRLGSLNAIQLALDGVFVRFPDLKIFFAETQIAWLPFFLEQADIRYDRHWYWAQNILGWEPLPQKPTDYIRHHCLWGFQEDRVGVELRHRIGIDQVMWATDFPHQESEFPHSRVVIDRVFAGVPEPEKRKMVAQNAIDFLHLDAEATS